MTVITPSRDQGTFLEQAICSVLDQNYDNLQYLVIDGDSQDESPWLVRHYDDELAWWQSRPDKGPADAINQGLCRADGEIICIVPADGLLLPGALHAAANRMAAADRPDWVIGPQQRLDERDEVSGLVHPRRPASLAALLSHDAGAMPCTGAFFRRSLFARWGGFDAGLRYAYGYDFSCRLLAEGVTPEILPRTVSASRDRPRETSAAWDPVGHAQSMTDVRRAREQLTIQERYAPELPQPLHEALLGACQQRRGICDLAEADAARGVARRSLWRQILNPSPDAATSTAGIDHAPHPWQRPPQTARSRAHAGADAPRASVAA